MKKIYVHEDESHIPWKRVRYIYFPKFLWYVTGRFIYEFLYDYWWVRIAKKKPLWPDADSQSCIRKFCRYCGKGAK